MALNFYVKRIYKLLKNQFLFCLLFTFIISHLVFVIMEPALSMKEFSYRINIGSIKSILIQFGPKTLRSMKTYYQLVMYVAIFILVNDFYERFLKGIFNRDHSVKWYDIKIPKYPFDKHKFQYIVGLKHEEENLDLSDSPKWITIEEDGLHQNVLVPGTIGQGKTIAQLTQFTKQMIYYEYDNPDKKVALLALDVKGNYYKFVTGFAAECKRLNDLIVIELGGRYKYNPIHKPNLSELELAKRMRDVLELFAATGNDTYWIDKAEDTLTEVIKLIRIYNDGYVDMPEVHKVSTDDAYRSEKISYIDELLEDNKLREDQIYNFQSARHYFKNEFDVLDPKAVGFIKSEITRITQPFISTKVVKETFCPNKEEINFYGFEDVIESGKIVVWKINANKEPKIAKLVAAYLKLDFQKEILITLTSDDKIVKERKKVTICDEYQEYVTANDADFLSQSREPRSVMCAATQSYSSIKKSLKNEVLADMLLQNFVNKIWMRSDDEYTVKKVMNQIGKEEKKKVSKTLTESSRNSRASYSLGKVLGRGKSLSEGISINYQKDYRFDEHFLTQGLDTYKGVCFISTGKKILRPSVVHLLPLFQGTILLDGKDLKFVTDEKLIFKQIGNVDLSKLDNETVTGLKESDYIDSERELGFNSDRIKNKLIFRETPEIDSNSELSREVAADEVMVDAHVKDELEVDVDLSEDESKDMDKNGIDFSNNFFDL